MSYILGLDVGSKSIGWAVVASSNGTPSRVEAVGVRVFQAGVQGDPETGAGEPPGAKRRQTRQQRRLTDRHARRMKKLCHLLQRQGLLPAGEADQVLRQLDSSLYSRYVRKRATPSEETGRVAHLLPYLLRARALDQPLEPHELGRALYHLAQRRGFLSNRRAPIRGDDRGKVRPAITELEQKMNSAGARTLGEYFATLDPEQERIRRRYTSRAMYVEEFEKIWDAQAPFYPHILTDDFKKAVRRAIFYQRPLRKQKNLIGACEFEPRRKRAPWALLGAQRFRMLQMVNNTRVLTLDGRERELIPEERAALIQKLETDGDLTFAKAKKLLSLKRDESFNWETGEESRFVGNRTNAKLAKIFGQRWWKLTEDERERVVEDVRSIERPATLAARGQRAWGLRPEEAEAVSRVELEPGYCRLSRQALAKLLPLLQQGLPYMKAVEKAYPDYRMARDPVDLLPPVSEAVPELRNPAVARALTELRKVANSIVRTYGKPEAVRIELARELRKTRQQRQTATKRNRQVERQRKEAAQKITAEAGIQNPKRADIEKVMLAEECNWQCPYTGNCISMASLFGPNPQFDVDHIIPFRRSLDNSFFNKTLSDVAENRNVKGDRTPYEAYAGRPEKYKEIIERVSRFQGRAASEKLARFQLEQVQDIEQYADQELNDTKYASRMAADYVGLLYGGQVDATGKRRVQPTRGRVTAFLRNLWGLNGILGPGPEKSRDDHRHHAVDAVVIALTDAAAIKALSDAAARGRKLGRRWAALPEPPWPGLLNETSTAVDMVVVSHRPSRKLSGALHEETLYSPPRDDAGRPAADGKWVHVRKPLAKLTKPELEKIVDPAVRDAVRAKLAALGATDPKRAFKPVENHPCLKTRTGRLVPIHKVRIRRAESPVTIGSGARERHVKPGDNHHIEIVELRDKKGRSKWEGHLVTRLEAARRFRARQPVVRRDHGPDKRFLFSLAGGDTIELDWEGSRQLFVVRTMTRDASGARIWFVHLNEARPEKQIVAAKQWHSMRMQPLRKANCRKVSVGTLGEVHPANH